MHSKILLTLIIQHGTHKLFKIENKNNIIVINKDKIVVNKYYKQTRYFAL
jgi:hypothetical protein